jgi:hypothetical protein
MKIRGIEGMSDSEIVSEVQRGARFVIFYYCISIIVMTFRRGSDVYFIRPEASAFVKGFPYLLLSLVLGWWGLPWGPIYTVQAIALDCRGGKDVTSDIVRQQKARTAAASSAGA